jgi:hypothetical protein
MSAVSCYPVLLFVIRGVCTVLTGHISVRLLCLQLLSVACLYSVCVPFSFLLIPTFSFSPCKFISVNMFASFIYFSFFHYKFFCFDVCFCFPSSIVVTKIVLSFFSRFFSYILFPPFSRTLFSLPRPSAPDAAPHHSYLLFLRRNGHPFLLAFVIHSCLLLCHFTVDVPSHHSTFRHCTAELLLL